MASTDENIRKLKERFDKGAVGKAADRGVLDLTVWAENMKKRLEKNFGTQNIWPLGNPGPYIGYRNTRSAKRHKSGQSLQKFYAQVYAGAGGDTEKISFFFNYYLYFVDMGVAPASTFGMWTTRHLPAITSSTRRGQAWATANHAPP
jgi:hypothetical protein